jgi:outer membrane protein OmpA-like peptidoglycan-associated protein
MKFTFRLMAVALMLSAFGAQAQKLDHYVYDHDTLVKDAEDNVYKVENLGENVNSRHIESGPIISPDGNTLFYFKVDTNYKHSKVSQEFHSDILTSEFNKKDSSWGEAENLGKPLNCNCANSVQAVVNDGNTLILTNHYKKGGLTTKGISISHRNGNNWTFPEPLHIKVHFKENERYSVFMNNEMSIMILAVHDNASLGHQDLFVSFSDDKKNWSAPLNLGETINTEQSEATAFLAADNKTLYFSSNGHPGSLGGMDIYKAERLDSTWTNWSKPVNMGVPFNTTDNEFYFTIPSSGEYSYLAHHFKGSDAAEHSDIVRIKLTEKAKPKVLVLSGFTFDDQTKAKIPATYKVTLIDNEDVITSGNSDTTDGYETTLALGKQYKLTFDSPGYYPKEITVDASQLKEYTEKTIDVYLTPEPMMTLSGFIYNAEDSTKVDGTLEIRNKATGEIVFTATSSATNGYEIQLPGGVDYEIMAGSPGLLEDIYHLDLTNLEGRQEKEKDFYLHCLACSFEVEDIFFAYNKANLKESSFEKLDQVVKIMLKHPELKVELSAHTDARGSDTYNKDLSQRRANSAVKYLVDHGIPANQFTAVGYGEDKVRNKCTNGVKCSDEEHEYNRRVEFKILQD